MEINHNPNLTSAELSSIWGSYQNDTLGKCTISYLLETTDDEDIGAVLAYGLELAENHIEVLTNIFHKEKLPVPQGFGEQDVNLQAPRLFSNPFMLLYIQQMGAIGLNLYSIALSNSARKDIRDYYTHCIQSSSELFNRATEVMQNKGLFIRPPYIPYPQQVEFIHSKQFLAGWLGEKRPLSSVETSFLFFNLQRNVLGRGLITGFSQVTNDKKVRNYMVRGAEIAAHHSKVVSKFLDESNLMTPSTSDAMPTESTVSPFSDKLMMLHITALNSSSIGYYGSSIGASPRRDIAGAYVRMMAEVGEYAAEGSELMIKKGWLEKPPMAPNRKDLAKG
jgi:hypothetical protein